MPLVFQESVSDQLLRQGEILLDIYEHRVLLPCDELDEDADADILSEHHPRLIVMSQDCDLSRDFESREPERCLRDPGQIRERRDNAYKYAMSHILVCEVMLEQEIRERIPNTGYLTKIQKNELDRYHRIGPAPLANHEHEGNHDFYLDFRRTFSLATDQLYQSVLDIPERRFGVIPTPYLQNLTHRYFGFLARVALPSD